MPCLSLQRQRRANNGQPVLWLSRQFLALAEHDKALPKFRKFLQLKKISPILHFYDEFLS